MYIEHAYQFINNDTGVPFNLKTFKDKNFISQVVGVKKDYSNLAFYYPDREIVSDFTVIEPLSTYLVISKTFPYYMDIGATPTPTTTPFPTPTPTPT